MSLLHNIHSCSQVSNLSLCSKVSVINNIYYSIKFVKNKPILIIIYLKLGPNKLEGIEVVL